MHTHVRRTTLGSPIKINQIFIDDPKNNSLKKVNEFLMLKKIGQGSFGKVYIGKSSENNQLYAIKVFSLDSQLKSPSKIPSLEREIRIMRMMEHPNILKLHKVLHSPFKNTVYLILDYASLGSLQRIIDNKIEMSEITISSIFKQIINGLEYLHKQGIVHQDIKPSNLLLSHEGIAKIADFGIGHSFQSANMVFGSPAYQAPEAFDDDNENDNDLPPLDVAKEDIWSLGVTLYQAVFHQLPFIGENYFEIAKLSKQYGLIFTKKISNEL